MTTGYDGQGTTVTFGSSGFAAKLIAVGGPSITRAAIDGTTMDSAKAMEYFAANLYDGGEVTLTVEHDGSDDPPIDDDPETITVNWGGLGNSTSFSAFCTGYNPGAAIGERMQAELTLKVTGAITF